MAMRSAGSARITQSGHHGHDPVGCFEFWRALTDDQGNKKNHATDHGKIVVFEMIGVCTKKKTKLGVTQQMDMKKRAPGLSE